MQSLEKAQATFWVAAFLCKNKAKRGGNIAAYCKDHMNFLEEEQCFDFYSSSNSIIPVWGVKVKVVYILNSDCCKDYMHDY